MEIFELRYFLGVARHENIHKASLELNVSPASLSKAVSRIEDELQVKLFERQGRNIKLTDQGRVLKIKGSQIVQLEEAARIELIGKEGALHVVFAGPEVLLSNVALRFSEQIKMKHPLSTFEFQSCSEKSAIERVREGDVHFAIITQDTPIGVVSRDWGKTSFVTVVGRTHPLYKSAKANKEIPIDEVLRYSFVSPNNSFLGQVGQKQSLDGWRDDKFPRQIDYLSSSLQLIKEVVMSGRALAYLPDYIVQDTDEMLVLKVKGCPYTCEQRIKLITRAPIESSWLKQVF